MKIVFCLFSFIFLTPLYLQAQIFKSKPKAVKVSFYSKTPLEDITALNSNSVSFIVGDSIKFSLANTGFIFPKPLMQEHFNENYMESTKYPKSTFSGKINEKTDLTKDGVYRVSCSGLLYIHGVEKRITVPGVFEVKNGQVNLKASFPILLDDYNIKRPNIVIEKIAEQIEIKIDADYLPYQKK